MSKLYIIGNGFDLKHDLPSSYCDFAKFCKTTNCELFETINLLFPQISIENLWSNFEEGLGQVDLKRLYDFFYIPYKANIRDDKFLELQEKLRLCFRDWVISLKKLTGILQKHYVFDDNDCFVSFNYTDTLETGYDIKSNRILHIHGFAKPEDEDFYADYIFGHKQSPQKNEENIDSFDYLSKDLINRLRKDFQIQQLEDKICLWKQDCITLEKIVVLGHSLNEIDDDYMQELITLLPNIPWSVEYFDYEDKCHKMNNIVRNGIAKQSQVVFIKS